MGSTGKSTQAESGAGSSGVVEFQDGDTTIQFDTPLIYSDTKQSLGKANDVILAFENKQVKAKKEHSILVMDDGSVVEQNTGGKQSVSASTAARVVADILSHNHPRGDGVIGGTFSSGDLGNFLKFNQRMYRATAKEGTYVISKGANYDSVKAQQMVQEYKALEKAQYKENVKLANELQSQYVKELDAIYSNPKLSDSDRLSRANEMYKDMSAQLKSQTNALLIEAHNWLLERAKTCGLIYTLERRG